MKPSGGTSSNQGRFLSDLRRSNAAGVHDNRKPRSRKEREAINMSILDDDFDPYDDTDLLDEIEDEDDLYDEDEY
jgi:hypothetical protein